MSSSAPSDKARYEQQLSHYRSLARAKKDGFRGKPFLMVHLNFWIESVQFLITGLEFWEYTGEHTKYKETIHRINKAFEQLHRLVTYLDDENYPDPDTNPEI